MAKGGLSRLQWATIGLAILGGLAALINEWIGYRRRSVVDWGHVAMAFGVPILIYALMRGASARRS